MSVLGSLNTAVLGLNAQSAALGHISDNIANSQTIGYKRVDTSFEALVLESNARQHDPGGVIARPDFANTIQGPISQSQVDTHMAIQGQGFFSVTPIDNLSSAQIGIDGVAQTTQSNFYTRVGDFDLDKDRFLVNSAGYALNGWSVDPDTGQVNQVASPIQITSLVDPPIATQTVKYAANLPVDPPSIGSLPSSSVQVFDAEGTQRSIDLTWRPQGNNVWRLDISAPDSTHDPVDKVIPGQVPTAVPTPPAAAGSASVKQVTKMIIGDGSSNPRVGDNYSITVDGVTYSVEITNDNIRNLDGSIEIARELATQINGTTGAPITARAQLTDTNGKVALVLTGVSGGQSFSTGLGALNSQNDGTDTVISNRVLTGGSGAAPATAQVKTFSFSPEEIDIGDTISVSVPDDTGTGTVAIGPITVTASDVAGGVSQFLQTKVVSAINNYAGTPRVDVTASAIGNQLILKNSGSGGSIHDFTSIPTASFSNDSATMPIEAPSPVISARVNDFQTQQITIGDQIVGDVGTVYEITVPGAEVRAISVTDNSSTGGTSELDFDGTAANASVGAQFHVTVNGFEYSLLITEDNVSSFTTDSEIRDYFLKEITALDTRIAATSATGSAPTNAELINIDPTSNFPSYDMTQDTPANLEPITARYTTTGDEQSVADVAAGIANAINAQGGSIVASASNASLTLNSTVAGGAAFLVRDSNISLTTGNTPPYIEFTFGDTAETAGTLVGISTTFASDDGTTQATANQATGRPAQVSFDLDYGAGSQRVTLNLGSFGEPNGLTQHAGENIQVNSVEQDGSPRGQFSGVSISSDGEVEVSYDNGRVATVAQVPLVVFNNPDSLKRESGGTFLDTPDAGGAIFTSPQVNGAGKIINNSLEGANVDIADEFTKLIVTQRSYSANTRVISTSDQMLQEVLGLVR